MANPPSEITRANALRGTIVRLECPHELPEGDWDGPVYVRLREPRYIDAGHTSPFMIDDSSRRPGWLCDVIYRRYDPTVPSAPSAEDLAAGLANVIIPYSRLTRPEEDLSREFQDRPLLLLFRFVRFRNCFVTAGADSRRFIEVSQTVFLVGQVVAYKSCEGLSFTTPSGVALQPTSNYMCVVTIRQPESAVPVHVLIPAQAAWDSIIPRNEYVVGWCHGVPAHSSPARRTTRFRTRWKEFIVPTTTDEELQRLLRDAFVPTGSDTTVDFGAEPFPLITEFGRVISVTPLEFARTYIGPTRSTARVDADVESDSDDPADILAVGMSRGRPLPRQHPRVTCLETLPRLSFPAPEHWINPPAMTTGEQSTQAVPASTATEPDHAAGTIEATPTGVVPPHQTSDLPAPAAPGISDAVIATLMSLAQSTQQMVATTQQLLREQRENQQASVAHATVLGPPQTGVTVDTTVVSTGMGDSPPPSNRQLRSPGSRRHYRSGQTRRSASGSPRGRPRHRTRGRSRSNSPTSRSHRAPRDRSRSRDYFASSRECERDARNRAEYRVSPREADLRSRYNYSDSPHGSTGYQESRFHFERGALRQGSRDQDPSPRDHQRDERSPPSFHEAYRTRDSSHREHGGQQVRDSDLLQHTISELMAGATSFRPPAAELRVHQVANVGPRPNGTYNRANLQSYWDMSILDRVAEIQHRETLRSRYRVTKVTAKMFFAVNFGTRQLDHFLPPTTQSGGERSITHDPATWSSADTSPAAFIQTIRDLRLALSRIEEAAVEWYPRPVAEVFRCVHSNSRSELLDHAPQQLVHATINLYTHVFSTIFHSIREGLPAGSLVPQAEAIMRRGSPEYERLVRNVIDEGLIATWNRHQPTRHSPRSERPQRSRQTRATTRERPSSSTIPAEIKTLIPVVNGSQVCLRSQTVKGCDFTGCRNNHDLVRLPQEVVDYLTNKHGALKPDHPNLST